MIMDKIYNKIVENNKKPYIWTYSRFENSNQNMINDILFQSLNPFQFFHFNDTASSFFKVDFSKILKENEYVADLLDKRVNARAFTYNDPFVDDIDEPMEDEEMIEEGNTEDGDVAERDFIDEMLAEEDRDDHAGMAVEQVRADNVWHAMDAPIAWNPGRYAIYDDGTMRRATADAVVVDHDSVINPTAETVGEIPRDIREALNRATAELASRYVATTTDDGEGHG
jgi:hypothetical protein